MMPICGAGRQGRPRSSKRPMQAVWQGFFLAKTEGTLLAQDFFLSDYVLGDGKSSLQHAGEQRGAEQQHSR